MELTAEHRKRLIAQLINREGGYVNDPNDRGGPTKWGITQKTLSRYLKRPASIDEVRNLEKQQAEEIYDREYLSEPRIDLLPYSLIDPVFDCAVHSGPRKAIILLQDVLNQVADETGLPVIVDGILGPGTRAAAIAADRLMGGYLRNAYCDHRLAFIKDTVRSDPSQVRFLRGWINRIEALKVPV